MNQTSRTIPSSSSTYLFNKLNFQLKFDSFGSCTKFNESIIESSIKYFSSWFGSLPALCTIIKEMINCVDFDGKLSIIY